MVKTPRQGHGRCQERANSKLTEDKEWAGPRELHHAGLEGRISRTSGVRSCGSFRAALSHWSWKSHTGASSGLACLSRLLSQNLGGTLRVILMSTQSFESFITLSPPSRAQSPFYRGRVSRRVVVGTTLNTFNDGEPWPSLPKIMSGWKVICQDEGGAFPGKRLCGQVSPDQKKANILPKELGI